MFNDDLELKDERTEFRDFLSKKVIWSIVILGAMSTIGATIICFVVLNLEKYIVPLLAEGFFLILLPLILFWTNAAKNEGLKKYVAKLSLISICVSFEIMVFVAKDIKEIGNPNEVVAMMAANEVKILQENYVFPVYKMFASEDKLMDISKALEKNQNKIEEYRKKYGDSNYHKVGLVGAKYKSARQIVTFIDFAAVLIFFLKSIFVKEKRLRKAIKEKIEIDESRIECEKNLNMVMEKLNQTKTEVRAKEEQLESLTKSASEKIQEYAKLIDDIKKKETQKVDLVKQLDDALAKQKKAEDDAKKAEERANSVHKALEQSEQLLYERNEQLKQYEVILEDKIRDSEKRYEELVEKEKQYSANNSNDKKLAEIRDEYKNCQEKTRDLKFKLESAEKEGYEIQKEIERVEEEFTELVRMNKEEYNRYVADEKVNRTELEKEHNRYKNCVELLELYKDESFSTDNKLRELDIHIRFIKDRMKYLPESESLNEELKFYSDEKASLMNLIDERKNIINSVREKMMECEHKIHCIEADMHVCSAKMQERQRSIDKAHYEYTKLEQSLSISNQEKKRYESELKQAELETQMKKREMEQLEEAYTNLDSFIQMYKKIQSDFYQVVNDSKNSLQVVQSTWDTIEKNITNMEIHDIKNDINAFKNYALQNPMGKSIDPKRLELYQKVCADISKEYDINLIDSTHDVFLAPCLEKIREELHGLEHVLDLHLEEKSVQEILDSMTAPKAIPENLQNNIGANGEARNKIYFEKNVQGGLLMDKKCAVIISKMQSIVKNLISNSSAQVANYKRSLRRSGKKELVGRYTGQIALKIYEENNSKGIPSLCFEVSDNAGGFPKDILSDIYKKPVASSKKDGRKYGEGTSYIGFFVKLMNGEIIATNYDAGNDLLGAKTKIFIPYK